jgi:hypothetical protein
VGFELGVLRVGGQLNHASVYGGSAVGVTEKRPARVAHHNSKVPRAFNRWAVSGKRATGATFKRTNRDGP